MQCRVPVHGSKLNSWLWPTRPKRETRTKTKSLRVHREFPTPQRCLDGWCSRELKRAHPLQYERRNSWGVEISSARIHLRWCGQPHHLMSNYRAHYWPPSVESKHHSEKMEKNFAMQLKKRLKEVETNLRWISQSSFRVNSYH